MLPPVTPPGTAVVAASALPSPPPDLILPDADAAPAPAPAPEAAEAAAAAATDLLAPSLAAAAAEAEGEVNPLGGTGEAALLGTASALVGTPRDVVPSPPSSDIGRSS